MSGAGLPIPTLTAARPASSLMERVIGRAGVIRRNVPFIVLGLIALLAFAWPLVVPYDPLETRAGAPLEAPSAAHLFGTDQSGRDVFSRILAGTRVSFTIGLASVALAVLVGGLLGVVSATAPRWIGELVMRCMDLMLAFPGLLLAIVVAAAMGRGQIATVMVIAFVSSPPLARFVRALTLGQLEEDYVAAARLLGTGRIRLLGYHVGINIAVPVIVLAATMVSGAILLEAALSYLGLGVPPPSPSWGNIISDGQGLLYSGQWWISGFGGLAVLITVLAFNSAANALNRRLDAGMEKE